MSDAVGATLGYAVGVAISPIPIAAVILMLFSDRARTNSVSFMVGWLIGIAVAASVVVLIPGLEASDAEPSTTSGWIKLAFGGLLVVFGAYHWRMRPSGDDDPPMPGWMERIDQLGPAAAFGTGFVLSAVNPKNLLLAASAGATLAALPLSTGETVAGVVVFTVIASISVTVPVISYFVAGNRLDQPLGRVKSWLIANNSAVLAVLFIVFGVNLIGDAVQILL